MVDVAEKNYLMGEIQKSDRQIEKLSWCVVWMILLRSRNKNNGILLILSAVLAIVLFIPSCIYFAKKAKRRKLINQYVYRVHIEGSSLISLPVIYSELEYAFVYKYLYKLNGVNGLMLNEDKTLLSTYVPSYTIEERLEFLRDEFIILFNSETRKSFRRRNEIKKRIIEVLYLECRIKTVDSIKNYCSNTLFKDYSSFNQFNDKFVNEVVKKVAKKDESIIENTEC